MAKLEKVYLGCDVSKLSLKFYFLQTKHCRDSIDKVKKIQ